MAVCPAGLRAETQLLSALSANLVKGLRFGPLTAWAEGSCEEVKCEGLDTPAGLRAGSALSWAVLCAVGEAGARRLPGGSPDSAMRPAVCGA